MNEIQCTNKTHFFIKNISISFYSRKEHTFCCKFERWRNIYLKRRLPLAPYLLPGARGRQCLHPLESCIVRDNLTPLIGCVSMARLLILNLTGWFSFHVVPFRLHTCSICLPRHTAIPCFIITT